MQASKSINDFVQAVYGLQVQTICTCTTLHQVSIQITCTLYSDCTSRTPYPLIVLLVQLALSASSMKG